MGSLFSKKKMETLGIICLFSRRLLSDWGNNTWPATADLGSIGFIKTHKATNEE